MSLGTIRSQHWTDVPTGGKNRRRSIGNWANYQSPAGLWLPSDLAVGDAMSVPDDWSGPDFNFTKHVTRGPLQLYFGDTSDPDNSTMIGARLSDAPGKWVQVQAQGVTPGVPMQVVAAEKQVKWVNLWPESTLIYQAIANGFRKYLWLNQPGHPVGFDLAVRIPAGGSIVPDGAGAKILDSQGQEHLRIPAPWGMDSSAGDPQDGGGIPVSVEMEWGASFTEPSGDQVQVFRFVPNADDLDGVAYPVLVEPTVEIIGATDVEDGSISSASPTLNAGGRTANRVGFNDIYGLLCRIATPSAIPDGNITGFRLYVYPTLVSGLPQTFVVFIITDANNWVEGTAVNAPQIGSACHSHTVYNTVVWAGFPTGGCRVSGVDFDADATPPELYVTSPTWHSVVLKPAWAEAWRDITRTANGLIIYQKILHTGYVDFASSERGSNKPYFEVDYEEEAVGGGFMIGF